MKRIQALAAVLAAGLIVAAGCQSKEGNGKADEAEGGKISLTGLLKTPESVLHDAGADVYLVSNINGSPFGADGAGFISRVRADGSFEALKWIDGASEDVTLNAPKGMAIVGDILYVADISVVRRFNRTTGQPLGAIAIEGATFLNDLTAGPDGTVYVSDTGLGEGFSATGTDAIHAIGSDGAVRTIAKGKELGQPNGLAFSEGSVAFVTWATGTLNRVLPDGAAETIAQLPESNLDGVVVDARGDFLISSWAGACVYRVSKDGSETSVALADLKDAADLGYDAKRDRLLIPFFSDDKLEIVTVE